MREIGVELPPGRLVGELGFVTPNNRRTQTVECIESGEVLTITYDRLLEIYFDNPEFGYFFLRLASDRLLQNIARLEGIIAAGAGMADTMAPVPPAELRTSSDGPSGDESELVRAMETIDVAEPVKDVSPAAAKVTLPDVIVPPADGRRAVAAKLVERFALWSGVAGIIPVPFVDLAAVGSVQVLMLRRISQIYGVPFSANRGKALIASLAGSMIPASSGMGAASITKSVPVVGTAVSAVVMPALSAGATYAIGMAFIQHFASGGTLLDFNPRQYREFFKSQKEFWRTRSRVARAAAKEAKAAKAGSSSQSHAERSRSFLNWRKYLRVSR